MRNNEEVRLGDALGSMFSSFQISDQVLEHRVKKALSDFFGKIMDNYMTEVKVNDGILFLSINSSTLRHELFLNRIQLTNRLNEELGGNVISKIILK